MAVQTATQTWTEQPWQPLWRNDLEVPDQGKGDGIDGLKQERSEQVLESATQDVAGDFPLLLEPECESQAGSRADRREDGCVDGRGREDPIPGCCTL